MSALSDELEERLVFGDALMTKGDPQGELIVVQCEIERGGFERSRGIELRKREVQLLDEAFARLPDTPLHDLRRSSVQFRRGAIDAISIDIERYCRDEDAIWKFAPSLRHVELHGLTYQSSHVGVTPGEDDWTHVRDRLAPALESRRIKSLGLVDAQVSYDGPDYSDEEWGYLVAPTLGLDSVESEIAKWLVETKLMSTFTGLELHDVYAGTFKLLARDASAAQLDNLKLGGSPYMSTMLDDLVSEALGATKLAPSRIALSVSRWVDDGIVADNRLTGSPFMSRVTDLTVPALEDYSIGRQLRRLEMATSFEPGWVERIANAPELSGLEELVLGAVPRRWDGTVPDPLDLRALCEPGRLESLRVLRLGTIVPTEAVRELLRSPMGQRLEVIEYSHAKTETAVGVEDWDGLVVTR